LAVNLRGLTAIGGKPAWRLTRLLVNPLGGIPAWRYPRMVVNLLGG